MLQGGDFRNISDYDIRMAGSRIGNLMDLINNPKTARPVLEQLREQAQFQLEVTQAFTRGNIYDVAAASLLQQYRGRNPQNPLEFIDVYYGGQAGLGTGQTILDPSRGSSGSIPFAGENE